MKKLFIILISLTFILTSCSKENMLNKRLDGTWRVVKINELFPDNDDFVSYSFIKGNNGCGEFVISANINNVFFSASGTYELTNSENLVFIYDDNSQTVVSILEFSKKYLKFKDISGSIFELEKL